MAVKKKAASKKTSSGRAPRTMEELLALSESPIKFLSRGQRVKGKILNISKKSVTIDIGGKSEGLVAERAFNEAKGYIKTLKVGDEITAMVLVPETPEGFIILSLRSAAQSSSWKKLEAALKKGETLGVTGTGANPSGVTVEVEGLLGFVPNSQLSKQYRGNPQELIGKRFEVKVLDLDKTANKIILSERGVSEQEDIKLTTGALKKIKEGDVYDGQVTKIYAFGCFVSIRVALKNGEKVSLEGLVHISEMSWEKVNDPKEVVSEGDKVKVEVIGKKGDKLSLSIKQAQKDPWEDALKKYKKDAKVKGKVVKVSDYGIFVQLEPGVEGLIHMTKIPPGKKLKYGDEVQVYVEEIDSKERKLSLGLVLTTKPVGYK